ncbi:conserved hypothetical protein [Vibrio owensii]|uniref:hypothetical protein n=1 Tax=Vibrio TaxID=662 RepID=UPI00028DFCBA|nr:MULTISPECIES: hypothetical protein [Vibrio]EKM27871.1 hypothetical protein VCHENC03_3751 [Vibrio sp. HENC-03]NOI72777.1 hypothetical protein [Vibrio owensii]CAH1539256.1 conserved hypothetical protein [Vibrio owensii]CAH1590651.1 conserved hypothetical protein [Vibrio owensii]
MLSDVDNANLFARCLIDEGLEVCKLRDENAEANKVMVKWHHEEGSASACNRLASVGIFINVVSLPGDQSSQESGLLFELNELTRLGINPNEIRMLAEATAGALLGRCKLEFVAQVVAKIASRLSGIT